jgi:hypothetical protein
VDRARLTQVGRALAQLGVEHIPPRSMTAIVDGAVGEEIEGIGARA